MTAQAERDFPGIRIVGSYSPPFRPMTDEEDEALVQQINQAGAQLVFLALGCPKQEKWMAAHHGRVHAVMLGVGWVFYIYSGLHKRAPKWMRTYSLEWLYRLILEPRRLFMRYFTTNLKFLWLISGQIIRHALGKNAR